MRAESCTSLSQCTASKHKDMVPRHSVLFIIAQSPPRGHRRIHYNMRKCTSTPDLRTPLAMDAVATLHVMTSRAWWMLNSWWKIQPMNTAKRDAAVPTKMAWTCMPGSVYVRVHVCVYV